jgi:hypothetical protein
MRASLVYLTPEFLDVAAESVSLLKGGVNVPLLDSDHCAKITSFWWRLMKFIVCPPGGTIFGS